jgi:peptidyl-tRNA hydrolase, PTH1 family
VALFQRKEQFTIQKQLFTVGLNKSFLIVGLGNVGREYVGTRHNIGFACIDDFLVNQPEGNFSKWQKKTALKSSESLGTMGDIRVALIKPTTYMNLSGQAVGAVMRYYKIPIDRILVIHDELDMNFGQIRVSIGGSSAGHNGVQSIIDEIGEAFARLRIGIGPKQPPQIEGSDFVLAKFSEQEKSEMPSLKKEVSALLIENIYSPAIQADTRSFLV